MVSRTVLSAFDAFCANIKVTDAERLSALERAKSLSGEIARDPRIDECLITGSMIRSTAIRRYSDVDVVAVARVSGRQERTAAHLVSLLAELVRKIHPTVRVSGNALRVVFADGMNVDVLPALAGSGANEMGDQVYRVPSTSGQAWLNYVPGDHNRRVAEASALLGREFKDVVRVVKWWNFTHGAPMSSHEVEALSCQTFRTAMPDLPAAIGEFFEAAIRHDEADHSAGYVKLQAARDAAVEAVQSERRGDSKKAMIIWRGLLGEQFPIDAR